MTFILLHWQLYNEQIVEIIAEVSLLDRFF